MTKEAALKHIKGAWILGLISAGMTLLVVVLAASGVSILAEMGFDWWNLLDVALLLVLSIGVYRKSRISAVLLLVYFVLSKIYMWVALGNVSGLALTLLFGYFFVQGVRGTFAFQTLAAAEQGASPAGGGRSKKWLWILGGSVAAAGALVIAGLMYIGLMGPGTKVIPGAQVPGRFVSQVRDLGLLDPSEQIRFFYSDALVDIEEGFYLFTDRKVVVYKREYEEPAMVIPFSSIREMDAEWTDSTWIDSQIALTLDDDSVVWFPVSSEDGGDREFFRALRATWETESQGMND